MQGKIIKGVGGFYYVNTGDDTYECKAKGIFRNRKIKPVVGDDVIIDILDEDALTGNITDILPRKNNIIRPMVSNVDQAAIVFALSNPRPNYNLLDRFIIMMDMQDVKTIICLNKSDLVLDEEACKIKEVYESCGYDVIITSTLSFTDPGTLELTRLLKGKTTVFAGPSGVGKSSLLNALFSENKFRTGEISEKIKRGRHTTRHSELVCVGEDTYIMDTPGFTSLYVEGIDDTNLKDYYGEFGKYQPECRFNGCVHVNEPGCRVKKALEEGNIKQLRYDNYIQIYNELKEKRKW